MNHCSWFGEYHDGNNDFKYRAMCNWALPTINKNNKNDWKRYMETLGLLNYTKMDYKNGCTTSSLSCCCK